MTVLKRIFRYSFLVFLVFIVTFTVSIAAFMYTQPQFGEAPKGEWLERIKNSTHFNGSVFVNQIETSQGELGDVLQTLPDFIFTENGAPTQPLPTKFNENKTPAADSLCFVTWYGHSAFLFELAGKRILIDPMLGKASSPVWFGAQRFPYQKPIPLDEITNIDAVIISHDHYDHLDYETIMLLHNRVEHFYTALGVGSHLRFWGIPADKITELDWWEESVHEGIRLVSCPARHFSGRGFSDRNKTQWASWIIESSTQKLYFSGDGGYGPHFKEIGKKEGPFDFAMLECGQYNQAWKDIHMMPEQSVQAGIDVNASILMPIHWGAFNLSVHSWKEPISRFSKEAERLKKPFVQPAIGERFLLSGELPTAPWWKAIN